MSTGCRVRGPRTAVKSHRAPATRGQDPEGSHFWLTMGHKGARPYCADRIHQVTLAFIGTQQLFRAYPSDEVVDLLLPQSEQPTVLFHVKPGP